MVVAVPVAVVVQVVAAVVVEVARAVPADLVPAVPVAVAGLAAVPAVALAAVRVAAARRVPVAPIRDSAWQLPGCRVPRAPRPETERMETAATERPLVRPRTLLVPVAAAVPAGPAGVAVLAAWAAQGPPAVERWCLRPGAF